MLEKGDFKKTIFKKVTEKSNNTHNKNKPNSVLLKKIL